MALRSYTANRWTSLETSLYRCLLLLGAVLWCIMLLALWPVGMAVMRLRVMCLWWYRKWLLAASLRPKQEGSRPLASPMSSKDDELLQTWGPEPIVSCGSPTANTVVSFAVVALGLAMLCRI
mgnify:CR=1 FL=1